MPSSLSDAAEEKTSAPIALNTLSDAEIKILATNIDSENWEELKKYFTGDLIELDNFTPDAESTTVSQSVLKELLHPEHPAKNLLLKIFIGDLSDAAKQKLFRIILTSSRAADFAEAFAQYDVHGNPTTKDRVIHGIFEVCRRKMCIKLIKALFHLYPAFLESKGEDDHVLLTRMFARKAMHYWLFDELEIAYAKREQEAQPGAANHPNTQKNIYFNVLMKFALQARNRYAFDFAINNVRRINKSAVLPWLPQICATFPRYLPNAVTNNILNEIKDENSVSPDISPRVKIFKERLDWLEKDLNNGMLKYFLGVALICFFGYQFFPESESRRNNLFIISLLFIVGIVAQIDSYRRSNISSLDPDIRQRLTALIGLEPGEQNQDVYYALYLIQKIKGSLEKIITALDSIQNQPGLMRPQQSPAEALSQLRLTG